MLGEVRVLQVITSLLTGGAEHIVVQLAEWLSAKNVHCDICVFDGEDTPFMHEIAEWNEQHSDGEPIHVYKLGHSFYNPLFIVKLAKLMRGYDIVHTHNSSPQLFVAIAKKFMAKGKRPILCTTEHNTSNRKRQWKWYAPIESWMYSQYGHIVCISKIAEEKLREYMGGGWTDETSECYGRITTINNGVDVNSINIAEPAEDLLKQKENRKAIVMVAGFREQKDQDTLVRAMTRLDKDKYELWLVGIGDRLQTVKSLADKLNVVDRVRFVGLRMDIPNVLRAADVVVMSSHWEGLSLSNVEGMSAGKPFIASDVNGLREVTRGYGIMFREGDDEQFASIVDRLCSSPELYHRVAERCYHRALQYDISNMVDGYYNVYRSLVIARR